MDIPLKFQGPNQEATGPPKLQSSASSAPTQLLPQGGA